MLIASAVSLGCAGDDVVTRTQLMLVADTDIERLDRIAFEVSQGSRVRESGTSDVTLADAPFTMAVLREQGSLGPLDVRATGYEGDRMLVQRSATVSFVAGKTLTVVLHLVESCVDSSCSAGMTCTETGCRALEAAVLTPWDGTPPRLGDGLDAGVLLADAGPDAARPDGAGGDAGEGGPVWMQCGGRTVDVSSDVDHCGRCNRSCRSGSGNLGENQVAACIEGACGVACRALWDDCDGNAPNGCEQSLASDSENCGACGMTCEPEEYCWVGSCRPRS